MSAVYYDLEFLEDGRTIELISIGMVREDGYGYYAVSADMPVKRIRKHKWLMENVVPGLPGGAVRREGQPKEWLFDYGSPLSKMPERIADEVSDFIHFADDANPGGDVELWANYGAYDHVALCQLWGSMVDLPDGIPMFTHDIQQERSRLGLSWDDLPKQESGVHNALEDARHNRVMHQWLKERAS